MRIAERGAYCDLLFFQWEMGHLPTDHDRLAQMIGVSRDEFEDLWDGIKHKFEVIDGRYVNQRLESHRKKAMEKRDRQRAGARKTNAKRQESLPLSDTPSDTHSEALTDTHTSTSISTGNKPMVDSAKSTRPRGWPSNWCEAKENNLEMFKDRYPKRSGAQPWKRAREAINARLKEGGIKWSDILDGATRYAEHIRAIGKENTPFVMQAATFCGPECHFLEDWGVPQTDEEREQEQRLDKDLNELGAMMGLERDAGESDESYFGRVKKANERRLRAMQ